MNEETQSEWKPLYGEDQGRVRKLGGGGGGWKHQVSKSALERASIK